MKEQTDRNLSYLYEGLVIHELTRRAKERKATFNFMHRRIHNNSSSFYKDKSDPLYLLMQKSYSEVQRFRMCID